MVTSYFDNYNGHDISDGIAVKPRRSKLELRGATLYDLGEGPDTVYIESAPQYSRVWTHVTASDGVYLDGHLYTFSPQSPLANGESSLVLELTVLKDDGTDKRISKYDLELTYDSLSIDALTSSIDAPHAYNKSVGPFASAQYEDIDLSFTIDESSINIATNEDDAYSTYTLNIKSYDHVINRRLLKFRRPISRDDFVYRVPKNIGKRFVNDDSTNTRKRKNIEFDQNMFNVYESIGGIVVEPRGYFMPLTSSAQVISGDPPIDLVTLDMSDFANEDVDWVIKGHISAENQWDSSTSEMLTGSTACRQDFYGWINMSEASGSVYLDSGSIFAGGSVSFSGSHVTLTAGLAPGTGSYHSGSTIVTTANVERSNAYNFVRSPIPAEKTNHLKAVQRNDIIFNGNKYVGNTLVFPASRFMHELSADTNTVIQRSAVQFLSGSDNMSSRAFNVPRSVDGVYAIDIAASGSKVSTGWYKVENGLITSASIDMIGTATTAFTPTTIDVTGSYVTVLVD